MNHRRAFAAALLAICVAAGCASLNNDNLTNPLDAGLSGTWAYVVNNGYTSRYAGCTGDAQILEGLTFVDGMAVAPICLVSVYFEVLQEGSAFAVVPHTVDCSDGSSAVMSGIGTADETSLGGEWLSESEQGVVAAQEFSGSMTGSTILISETGRTFSGTFQGSCQLSPALRATIQVQ